MADSSSYETGDLILVRDQYQPLNPIPALVEGFAPDRPHLVKVRYRVSATVVWIDRDRIVGRDTRAQEDRRDDG